jgi:large subunit ribosomal protein L17
MRHGCKRHKLSRAADQRKAVLRALTTSLFREKQISTTLSYAKAMSSVVDKLVKLARRGDLHARRQAAAYITDKIVVADVFGPTAERYKERNSGFTRIVKNGFRRGDNTELAIIQLV